MSSTVSLHLVINNSLSSIPHRHAIDAEFTSVNLNIYSKASLKMQFTAYEYLDHRVDPSEPIRIKEIYKGDLSGLPGETTTVKAVCKLVRVPKECIASDKSARCKQQHPECQSLSCLESEAAIYYNYLRQTWGNYVPMFYGLYHWDGGREGKHSMACIILQDCGLPAVPWTQRTVIDAPAVVRAGCFDALEAVHHLGVQMNDLEGADFVMDDKGYIFLVDFSSASPHKDGDCKAPRDMKIGNIVDLQAPVRSEDIPCSELYDAVTDWRLYVNNHIHTLGKVIYFEEWPTFEFLEEELISSRPARQEDCNSLSDILTRDELKLMILNALNEFKVLYGGLEKYWLALKEDGEKKEVSLDRGASSSNKAQLLT